ncbi:MAG: T3SS effector HopA1 family protein [Terriglobia bacterium]
MDGIMETIHGQLSRILSAITILSPASFSFAGWETPAVKPADAGWSAINSPQPPLVSTLQNYLYQYCFCAHFTGTITQQTPFAGAQDDLSQELSAANSGQPRWEPGWQIFKVEPSGQIVAQRYGISRAFWPGEYVTHNGPGMGPTVGSSATVFFPKESLTMQPGFYFAFGEAETASPADYNLIRFYWNIDDKGAAHLMRLSTQTLNRFRIPFRMKSLTHRSQYGRLDPALVYLNKRYFRIAAELLSYVHRELAEHLGQEAPLFTLRLAPGLALAEDPGNGESFGMNRCRIVAEAIWSAYLQGEQGLPGRRAEVAKQFKAYGLNLDRPYLNGRSIDQYDPAIFEAASV